MILEPYTDLHLAASTLDPGTGSVSYAALLAVTLVTALVGWRQRGSRTVGALLVVLAAALPLWVVATDDGLGHDAGTQAAMLVTTGLLAVLGGGPVTAAVFRLVDGREPGAGSVGRAAEVLRGGAWIGSLERLAVFTSLACGWPEGLALTLALKGLGRYPELRHEERSGIAERFLIGTFVSVLWACAWAGTALLLT